MFSHRSAYLYYEKAVSAIIDWLEHNNRYNFDLKRIGTSGWSFGGYLTLGPRHLIEGFPVPLEMEALVTSNNVTKWPLSQSM